MALCTLHLASLLTICTKRNCSMKRFVASVFVACAAMTMPALADTTATASASPSTTASAVQRLPGGTLAQDIVVGKGPEAKKGDTVSVLYTGKLTSGEVFDSTSKRGNEPFEFQLGAGMVIKGWDAGVAGMKVGGKRKLTIPPDQGYGSRGAGGAIPPNATLVFDIELLKIK
jgi:FKBP-type peptidyl-prolyl cis-trans isomerase